MTKPALVFQTGGRKQAALTILLVGLMFLLGYQVVDPRASHRVLAGVGLICGLIAGLFPALGSGRPRLQRWLLLTQMAATGVMIGLVARMIFRGFRHLG